MATGGYFLSLLQGTDDDVSSANLLWGGGGVGGDSFGQGNRRFPSRCQELEVQMLLSRNLILSSRFSKFCEIFFAHVFLRFLNSES
jgi:hypothetical protein